MACSNSKQEERNRPCDANDLCAPNYTCQEFTDEVAGVTNKLCVTLHSLDCSLSATNSALCIKNIATTEDTTESCDVRWDILSCFEGGQGCDGGCRICNCKSDDPDCTEYVWSKCETSIATLGQKHSCSNTNDDCTKKGLGAEATCVNIGAVSPNYVCSAVKSSQCSTGFIT
ncbi:MAG: hypothetical protein JW841_01540 [Deltaproteobacteria bacterium]|nr:hypothetical protein [Deltaproteobacteria bacterium]